VSTPVPITEQEWASIAHLFDYNQGTETSGPGGAPTPPDLVNNLDGGVDVVDATCSIDGCERSPIARSLCSPHYARERKAGRIASHAATRPARAVRLCACGCGSETSTPQTEFVRGHRPPPPLAGAFWRQVAPRASGCWEWTGNVGDHGYGRFWDASARCNRLAHRVALGFRQALSDEMQVDHLCRNRICVRPDHLEEVTQQENIRRALPFRVTR